MEDTRSLRKHLLGKVQEAEDESFKKRVAAEFQWTFAVTAEQQAQRSEETYSHLLHLYERTAREHEQRIVADVRSMVSKAASGLEPRNRSRTPRRIVQ